MENEAEKINEESQQTVKEQKDNYKNVINVFSELIQKYAKEINKLPS